MKILLVDEFKTVNYSGGIEKVLCRFANEFVQRGYQVTFCCLDEEKGVPLFKLDPRVKFVNLYFNGESFYGPKYLLLKLEKEIFRAIGGKEMIFMGKKLPNAKREYFKAQFIKRLRKLVLEEKPDVLVNVSPDSNYFCVETCKDIIPKPKIICTIHTDPATLFPDTDAKSCQALHAADTVQFLLPNFEEYGKNFGLEHTGNIPNCVEPSDLQADVKNSRTIISVGRVEQVQKRHYLLLEAFAKIAADFPEWDVKIYGDTDPGSYYNYLKQIIKDNELDTRVKFMGVSKQVIVEDAKAAIFGFPSAFEGFGLAMTEAMSVGLPLVAFKNCSSVNSIIVDGETGLLSEDGVDAYAENLAKLMRDAELRFRLGCNAKEKIKEYAPQRVWDRWEQLIKSL